MQGYSSSEHILTWSTVPFGMIRVSAGVLVKIGEIVEIDDGLTSNCFYLTLNGVKYLPYWDTARARKNEYACKNSDN